MKANEMNNKEHITSFDNDININNKCGNLSIRMKKNMREIK